MQLKAVIASVSARTASELRVASVLLALDIIMVIADTVTIARILRGAAEKRKLRE